MKTFGKTQEKVINDALYNDFNLMPKVNFITKGFFQNAAYSTQRNVLRNNRPGKSNERYRTIERPKTAIPNSPQHIDKKEFQLYFNKESIKTLRARLAREDPITDPYVSPSKFNFKNLQPSFGQKDFCVLYPLTLVEVQVSTTL